MVAYFNGLNGDFQFDDYRSIVENQVVHNWSFWWQDLFHGIRPLLKLSYLFNWKVDSAPWVFHLTNLLIHLVNSLLVMLLSYKLMINNFNIRHSTSCFIALYCGLLFATHPIQTEVVTYISGRSMGLMTLFYLLSLLSWLKGIDIKSNMLIWFISPLFFVFSLLTRETALTLPLLMYTVIVIRNTAQTKPELKTIIPHVTVLLIAVIGMFFFHSGYQAMLMRNLALLEPMSQLSKDLTGYLYLIKKVLVPTHLSLDPIFSISWSLKFIIEVILLFAGLILSWVYRKKHPLIIFAFSWFIILLLPNLSIIPRNDIINERHVYFASLGFIMLFSKNLVILLPRFNWIPMLIIIGFFIVITHNRNKDYQTEISLWQKEVINYPNNARGWNNLGYAYQLKKQFKQARSAYLNSLSIHESEQVKTNLKRLSKDEIEWVSKKLNVLQ